ncbi:MAG: 30S ribosomal protein S8 [Candidatus Aenigmarchaeota archaeon]|nr:30S ribosomal protein S8 [Candidatus Aenigmarchaeota archaeon]
MLQDTLADALAVIKNAEKVGKRECVTRASKEIREVLTLLQNNGYIGPFEFVDDGRSGKFKIELKGKIINTNVVKPRYSTRVDEFEKWEKRFLPAREFGLLILTTPKGIIDHKKAKEMHTGGKLVAFVY